MTLRDLCARSLTKEPGRLSYISNRSNGFVWYETDWLWEKAHEGRRTHALASLRSCLGVLAFVAASEDRRRWFAALKEFAEGDL